jgi:protein-S-isoprenylcysteine O-methyltransferase Ste14
VTALDFFARWRVRIGYFLALVVLWFARPNPRSILIGGVIGVIGLAIRSYAAGYLQKQSVLTVAGPYARTRNPLYFGSSIMTLGAAVAMHSWLSAAILLIYFAVVYTFVMRREEMELRQQHGAAFDAYAQAVPLFFPGISSMPSSTVGKGSFSWSQYKKNHEHQAVVGFLLLLLLLIIVWRMHTA